MPVGNRVASMCISTCVSQRVKAVTRHVSRIHPGSSSKWERGHIIDGSRGGAAGAASRCARNRLTSPHG